MANKVENLTTGEVLEWKGTYWENTTILVGKSFTSNVNITIPDGGNEAALTIAQNDTTNNPKGARFVQAGTGDVIEFQQDGNGTGVFIDQNGNGTAIFIDSEATTKPAIEIRTNGDTHINFNDDSGNASPTEGDLWRESDGLKYFDGTTEHNLISTSTTKVVAVYVDNVGVAITTDPQTIFTQVVPANTMGVNGSIKGSVSIQAKSGMDLELEFGSTGSLTFVLNADELTQLSYHIGNRGQTGTQIIVGSGFNGTLNASQTEKTYAGIDTSNEDTTGAVTINLKTVGVADGTLHYAHFEVSNP